MTATIKTARLVAGAAANPVSFWANPGSFQPMLLDMLLLRRSLHYEGKSKVLS